MYCRKKIEFEGIEYTVGELRYEYSKRHPDLLPMSSHVAYQRIKRMPFNGDLFTPIVRKVDGKGSDDKEYETGKAASVKRLKETRELFGLLGKAKI